MKHILIIKTSAFGDIIHAYPTIQFLKQNYPDAEIDWVVESSCADLVRAHPDVSRALCVNTKKWRKRPFSLETYREVSIFLKDLRSKQYDVVFDLQGNVKSGLILSRTRSRNKVGFSRKDVPEWPNLLFTNKRYSLKKNNNIRTDYLSLVSSFLGKPLPSAITQVQLQVTEEERCRIDKILNASIFNDRAKVMVCPGSAWANKQLSESTLIEFLESVYKNSHCVFLFISGSQQEKALAERLNSHFPENSLCVERLTLPALQNLMNRCDVVIAMDSLPLHLAGTTSTRTFSVFGPSLARKYQPLGDQHIAYQGNCPYGRAFEKRCPILRTCPTGACMKNIPVKELSEKYSI